MRLKLSSSKKALLSLATLVAVAGALTVYAAGVKDFRLYLQANDGGCSSQLGTSRHTNFLNQIAGLSSAPWATDANGYDFDCLRVNLNPASLAPVATVTKDFRACLQLADGASLDTAGNVKGISQIGGIACTPWASEGGGSSGWASDSNKYDPDAGTVILETRDFPANKPTVEDVRVGIQLSDKACTAQAGSVEFTPWLSQGGGWSNWAHDSNAYDPDCAKLTLEVNSVNTCEEGIACSDQKVLSLNNNAGNPGEGTQYAVATRIENFFGITSIFEINKDLTYETWIYKIGHNRYGGIITAGVTDMRSNGWPSWFASGDGKSLAFRVGRSSDSNQCKGNCREYNLNQEIPTGKWTHVAVTVSGGTTLTWYVNGSQVKQENLANWDVSATPKLDKVYLGNEVPGASEYPNAKLDEVRVWNVARTAAQIKGAMNKKVAANETGLVNYWNFDNGTGNDITGHTEALQLKNGASITADPAIAPLKLCTKNTCGTPEPPAQTGDLMVARYGGPFNLTANPLSFGSPIQGTQAWIDNANAPASEKQSTNPSMFYQLPNLSQHTIYVTDLPNKSEIFSLASCARGSSTCAPWVSYVTIAASACNGTYCAIPASVPVTADTVLRVAVGYIDNTVVIPTPAPDPNPNPNPNPSVATCTITATPATIVLNVGSSMLSWSCTNGPATVTISDNNSGLTDIGTRPASGSQSVSPDATTIFTVTSGAASATATVNVGGSVIDETGGL